MFEFNGTNLKSLGVIALNSNYLDRFKRNIEKISVPGRTGNLIINNNSYDNLELEIECFLEDRTDIDAKLTTIENYLLSAKDYSTLKFKNKIFSAFFIEIKEIKNIVKNAITFKIVFTVRKGA